VAAGDGGLGGRQRDRLARLLGSGSGGGGDPRLGPRTARRGGPAPSCVAAVLAVVLVVLAGIGVVRALGRGSAGDAERETGEQEGIRASHGVLSLPLWRAA